MFDLSAIVDYANSNNTNNTNTAPGKTTKTGKIKKKSLKTIEECASTLMDLNGNIITLQHGDLDSGVIHEAQEQVRELEIGLPKLEKSVEGMVKHGNPGMQTVYDNLVKGLADAKTNLKPFEDYVKPSSDVAKVGDATDKPPDEVLIAHNTIQTGVPVIDDGLKCDQKTGGRCLFTGTQREHAFVVFGQRVARALTNEQAGIQNERDEVARVTETNEGMAWLADLVFGIASDGIITAFIGKLESVVVKKMEHAATQSTITGEGDYMRVGTSRIGETSRIEEVVTSIPENQKIQIENIKGLFAKGSAELKKRAKAAGSNEAKKIGTTLPDPSEGLDDTSTGKLTFLTLIEDMASEVSQNVSESAPAYLDDIDLAAAIQMFDEKYHKPSQYESMARGWIKQYDKNKIGELGSVRDKTGTINKYMYQVYQVRAYGKTRSAIFEWEMTTQDAPEGKGMEAYKLHSKPTFVQFVDANFAPLAKSASRARVGETMAGMSYSEFDNGDRVFDLTNGYDEIDIDEGVDWNLSAWVVRCKDNSEGGDLRPAVVDPDDTADDEPIAAVSDFSAGLGSY